MENFGRNFGGTKRIELEQPCLVKAREYSEQQPDSEWARAAITVMQSCRSKFVAKWLTSTVYEQNIANCNAKKILPVTAVTLSAIRLLDSLSTP